MSEINIEIDKQKAKTLLPEHQVLKCLRNGIVGDIPVETARILIDRSAQVGINAMGTAYSMGLALWAIHPQGGTVFIETDLEAVNGLSLSLGVELPN